MATTKWTINLEDSDADLWDDLTRELGREIGRRTLPKTEVVRTLMQLAAADTAVRELLVAALQAVD